MSRSTTLETLMPSLNPQEQQDLQQGEVILLGTEGKYAVVSLVKAPLDVVWDVLTGYEQFPDLLPSVVSSRVLERQDNRVWVERKDRRKVGLLPIKVKIVTENTEHFQDRIDYRMVEGTLDEMHGNWQVAGVDGRDGSPATLLMQTIKAKANLGPLQPYFYEVFEGGLTEAMSDLRSAMETRYAASAMNAQH
jgi:ribosome-associated toxin RatA of RatAB toxin-antitoxin module